MCREVEIHECCLGILFTWYNLKKALKFYFMMFMQYNRMIKQRKRHPQKWKRIINLAFWQIKLDCIQSDVFTCYKQWQDMYLLVIRKIWNTRTYFSSKYTAKHVDSSTSGTWCRLVSRVVSHNTYPGNKMLGITFPTSLSFIQHKMYRSLHLW